MAVKFATPMNNASQLQHYLDAELISVQRPISSPKKLLQEMAALLAQPLQGDSEEDLEKVVYHSLLEREKIGNTGIGKGVALPHSRCVSTHRAVIALITLAEAIDYDSSDRQPVDVAFGLIVPQQATQEHLNLLAEIARLMSVQENRDQLAAVTSATQAIELIREWSA